MGYQPRTCIGCSEALTRAERLYYGDRCEACEREWSDRMTLWRKGEIEEPELDSMFGAREATARKERP
jgi:hypothetical protein